MNTFLPSALSRAQLTRFQSQRLGLFLHWGLYSLEAWHEQDQWRRGWKREDYSRLIERFSAKRFECERWLDVADTLGAKYVCLTTKHADGFCLWDSNLTDFKVTKSPLGRDVVAELADACSRRGMALGLYYSVVDENHPSYPHAGRRWEYAKAQPGDRPSKRRYIEYVKGQVTELCTRYGPLHSFWWDANPAGWRDPSLNALIRKLQPRILINNRGFDGGDFGTPERDWDDTVNTVGKFAGATEACQALGNQSWGYRHEEDYYTEQHLLRSLAKILGKGGNYLLNTGPKGDGTLADVDRKLLRGIGTWVTKTREAWEGVKPVSDLIVNSDVILTRRDARTYYVILHRAPVTRSVQLKPFTSLPVRAVELTSGRQVEVRNDLLPWDHESGVGYLRLYNLPPKVLAETVPVVRLEFDRPPKRGVLEDVVGKVEA